VDQYLLSHHSLVNYWWGHTRFIWHYSSRNKFGFKACCICRGSWRWLHPNIAIALGFIWIIMI